jgi:hypothetical protein
MYHRGLVPKPYEKKTKVLFFQMKLKMKMASQLKTFETKYENPALSCSIQRMYFLFSSEKGFPIPIKYITVLK